MLEVGQVLGGADAARVEQLLVARGALADLVDVLLGLDQLALDVTELGLGGDGQRPELGEVGGALLDLGVLRQRAPAVGELVQAGVECLQVQQADLVGGRGVQGVLLRQWAGRRLWGARTR
ncbi:hypothetical protein ABIA32_004338 [Streptacidiphilus sp. MAP12-20]